MIIKFKGRIENISSNCLGIVEDFVMIGYYDQFDSYIRKYFSYKQCDLDFEFVINQVVNIELLLNLSKSSTKISITEYQTSEYLLEREEKIREK